ncbi:MAG TPA: SemiSWEET family transporter [Verrucomicrobiae bacterium]|nr:SemiSWEET family transporter [Verrucomicrobiae bacterium]
MHCFKRMALFVLLFCTLYSTACQDLTPKHLELLFKPNTELSEIIGFLAGLGTTFAAFPDLLAMLKRKSSIGMNPRMSTIMGTFQVLWIYYGMLIASRPVILWNVIAVCINFLTVGAYSHFLHKERDRKAEVQPQR